MLIKNEFVTQYQIRALEVKNRNAYYRRMAGLAHTAKLY